MKIYLAGSVPKGDDESKDFEDWRKRYSKTLSDFFDAEFIDPYASHPDEKDFLAVVGADCQHIKESTFIVVNAEEKLGAGTSQELVIAKYFKKPVITILPRDTYHRRSNMKFNGKIIEDWIHPLYIHFPIL